jgi:hypothetical protein
MKAGHYLKSKGINLTVIPMPREISSDCGWALEIQSKEALGIKELLEGQSWRMTGIYEFTEER